MEIAENICKHVRDRHIFNASDAVGFNLHSTMLLQHCRVRKKYPVQLNYCIMGSKKNIPAQLAENML